MDNSYFKKITSQLDEIELPYYAKACVLDYIMRIEEEKTSFGEKEYSDAFNLLRNIRNGVQLLDRGPGKSGGYFFKRDGKIAGNTIVIPEYLCTNYNINKPQSELYSTIRHELEHASNDKRNALGGFSKFGVYDINMSRITGGNVIVDEINTVISSELKTNSSYNCVQMEEDNILKRKIDFYGYYDFQNIYNMFAHAGGFTPDEFVACSKDVNGQKFSENLDNLSPELGIINKSPIVDNLYYIDQATRALASSDGRGYSRQELLDVTSNSLNSIYFNSLSIFKKRAFENIINNENESNLDFQKMCEELEYDYNQLVSEHKNCLGYFAGNSYIDRNLKDFPKTDHFEQRIENMMRRLSNVKNNPNASKIMNSNDKTASYNLKRYIFSSRKETEQMRINAMENMGIDTSKFLQDGEYQYIPNNSLLESINADLYHSGRAKLKLFNGDRLQHLISDYENERKISQSEINNQGQSNKIEVNKSSGKKIEFQKIGEIIPFQVSQPHENQTHGKSAGGFFEIKTLVNEEPDYAKKQANQQTIEKPQIEYYIPKQRQSPKER